MRKNPSYYDKSHPTGYNIISYPRPSGKNCGGLVVVYKNHIKLQKHCILQKLAMMECGHFQMKFRFEMVSRFVIYCIPNTNVLKFCEAMVSIFQNSIKTIRNKYTTHG